VTRLETGFRRRFRELLARVHPRRLDFGVDLLMGRAGQRAQAQGLPAAAALAALFEETRARVDRRHEKMGSCAVDPPRRVTEPPRFLCDASLDALARCLRAAGYEAEITTETGEALLAAAGKRLLLTTDALLWEGPALRERQVDALWLPDGLDPALQLDMVRRDLGLAAPPFPPRLGAGGDPT
jgi:hypothetical protein